MKDILEMFKFFSLCGIPQFVKNLFNYPRHHPLGWHVLISILLCSSLLALVATGIQLLLEYRRDVSQIELRMSEIERSYVDGIAVAVWHFDYQQVQTQLHGILQLPDIRFVQLTDAKGKVLKQAGSLPQQFKTITREMPVDSIEGVSKKNKNQLGNLVVTASLEGVYQRLLDQMFIILATQAVKTFIVAIFILVIFNRLVSQHLFVLANYARRLDVNHLGELLVLARGKRKDQEDELDILVSAINTMRDSIRRDFNELRQVKETLSRSEERYRRLVESTNVVPWEANIQDWNFTFVGPQAEYLLGFPVDLWYEPGFWFSKLHPEDRDRVQQALSEHKHGHFEIECRLIGTDQRELWVSVQAVLQFTAQSQGMLQGYLLSIDIRKRAELELVKYRENLEELVATRTEELAQKVSKLAETQNQLLQSEKMASIGQLAAGVAHEINNPIGFVHSNLGTLDKYLKDIAVMLEAYEQLETTIKDENPHLQHLNNLKLRIDLKFLKEDIPDLLEESRDGILRVKKIVQDLKDFSHISHAAEWQYANIHKGLDSTLNIAWSEVKYKAEVVKEYGNLPDIECLPSELNQVFMNIFVNAAHAIKERGIIRIRTDVEEEQVWVEISDTGEGISPENLKKIFDPFFTTKPIGKGTGLGLSLSYGIIQKHQGKIEVTSVMGQGTTFKIWLPIKHTENE